MKNNITCMSSRFFALTLIFIIPFKCVYLHASEMADPIDLFGSRHYSKQNYALFKQLAELDNADAQVILGCYFQFIEHNNADAEFWYRMAADKEDAIAQYNLAMLLLDDLLHETETENLLRKSAEQGLAVAQYNLGIYYERKASLPQRGALPFLDNNNKIQPDLSEAVKWYHKAAEQGLARAQYDLSVMYATGKGVPKNNVEAIKWRRMASEERWEDDFLSPTSLGSPEGVLYPNSPYVSVAFCGKEWALDYNDYIELMNTFTQSELDDIAFFVRMYKYVRPVSSFSLASDTQIANILMLYHENDVKVIESAKRAGNSKQITILESMYNAAKTIYDDMIKNPNNFSGIAKMRKMACY